MNENLDDWRLVRWEKDVSIQVLGDQIYTDDLLYFIKGLSPYFPFPKVQEQKFARNSKKS